MKYTESNEKIYTTTDYDGFVFTDWNRSVSNARVVKMVESIKNVGWLPEPVLVNEKFEVIDGQSRVKALEKLGMPVRFCIKKGIGRKECQVLNLFQKNWSTMDYINSYIADGNPNYIWLKSVMKRYDSVPASVIQGLVTSNSLTLASSSGDRAIIITSGKLSLSEDKKVRLEELLFYLSRFEDTATYLGGRKDTFYGALSFLYWLDGIDEERVFTVVNNARYDGKIVTSGSVEGWLQQIEVLYNKNLLKKNKVDLVHEYKVA